MRDNIRKKILDLLRRHRIMTVATLRPDGWPQATAVGFVSDGLRIYFLCAAESQKAANLARDNRVSLTIDHDVADPMAIEGLSMAALAVLVTEPAEKAKMLSLLAAKYPEYGALPTPDSDAVRIFRVEPTVISVLDYRKGFGHTDLVPADEVAVLA